MNNTRAREAWRVERRAWSVEREVVTLPNGWAWATLGEIARINYRDPAIRDLDDNLPVTFAPMAAVDAESGTIAKPEERPLSKVRKGFTSFCEDDVIFAKITPCMENGKAAIARGLVNRLGFGSTEFHVLRPEQGVLPEWIFYFVRQSSFREDAKARFAGTAGQLRVPSGFLESYTVPLAPTPEQHRIVAEIEKQFTRLDAGVAALKQVQANLKRYKASVLKAACEGRLVPQDPNDEPASELLERFLAERQRVVTKRKGAVTAPLHPPDANGLPELPEEWCWATLGQFGEVIGGFAKNSKRNKHNLQLPYLRVANVYAGELRLDDVQTIGIEGSELERLLLRKGDLLVVEGNGSIDQIGRVAIWDGSISPCIHQNHIIKVRLEQVEVGKYALLWLLSQGGRDQITRVASSTSGLYTLSLSKVGMLPVPLPSMPEQRRIVEKVERRLSVVQEVDAVIAANLARAERLRQSILKQAFEGKLAAQDSNDEPASGLLERIRAERGPVTHPTQRNKR